MRAIRDVALVVPSIREDSFRRFQDEWKKTGIFDRVDLILVEDNPEPTFKAEEAFKHFSWKDIDEKSWSSIIPRRSDTVRSFGYWWAWQAGHKYLMTLDDDCYPEPGFERLDLLHKEAMVRTKWYNTLNSVRPRGTPYKNLGTRQVYVNHGLWTGVLDYDAPQQLVAPIPETYTFDSRIVPQGAYHSFCGMNAMWKREAIPLSYHLLMGHARYERSASGQCILEPLPFDRFGDIWCGIIQKKICDHLGWPVASGTPYIHHDRASNPFKNLRKEAAGIEVNEWFWEAIDDVDLGDNRAGNLENLLACYDEIAGVIMTFGGEHDAYWRRLSQSMNIWANLFRERT